MSCFMNRAFFSCFTILQQNFDIGLFVEFDSHCSDFHLLPRSFKVKKSFP